MRVFHAGPVAVLCSLTAAVSLLPAAPPESVSPAPVSYQRQIQPIFSRHCFGCHQGAKQLGEYKMTDFAALTAGGESQQPAIVPGKPGESYLIDQITPVDGHAAMPQAPAPPLSDVEVELITRWVAEGAMDDSPADSGPRFDADHPPLYVGAPPLPSVDVSPDGTTIAVAGFHEVVLLDAVSGQRKSRLVGISPRINTVRFSPDGTRLAAVGGTPGERGELQVWQTDSGQLSLSLAVTYDTLCGASWSPDGSKIAFGATDNVVRAVDATSGAQVLYQGAHEDWVRDTAFTPDGKHVISVARDMSCKLTELETERFIDNITSITPGALSGGLSSVAAHPSKNEILIGGADGVAKVYRVFRETERKIGDDANLVRSLPKLDGRIHSVAISPDATRIAAAATLDNRSEVRIWKYDFDGSVSPELKTILAKRVADRSAEENKQVEAHRTAEVQQVARFTLDTAAIYAIAFAADNTLVMTAADGQVRRLNDAGEIVASFPACEIAPPAAVAASGFDAKAWNEMVTQRMEAGSEEIAPAPDQVTALAVEPATIDFNSPYDYAQLVVTAALADGSTADVTRLCDIEVPAWMTLTARGLVRPAADGTGSLVIRYGEQQRVIQATASAIGADGNQHGAVDYIRDVSPVLSRLGCNQGTCHGAQKGKNGFRLSLRGYDPIFDLRALTDDLAARRINPAAPEQSLMLRKPLGTSPHQGGTLMTAGDPYHTILRRWIADGSQLQLESPRVTELQISPLNPIVQSTRSRQQVRVVARYADGSTRDVTSEAFIESGNSEVATADKLGLLSAVRRGEAPILARFEGAYAATTLTVMGDRSGYQETETDSWSEIDQLVAQKWQRVKVAPSGLCDDATFLRRVHLDLTGLPPTSDQVREFLADDRPTRIKRAAIVDSLIGSEDYVDYWTNKWADMLLVNRKFLGVEGSTKLQQWIRQSVQENKPYDQFAREVLTAAGSNNDNPPAAYYKVLRTPEDTMENTTHLFLGIRFNCNKCHDHPFERWTQNQYYEMSAFFAQVGLERDDASGKRTVGGTAVEGAKPLFEKVVDKDTGDVLHPQTSKPVPPAFPFEVPHQSEPDATRRQQLAAWITAPENPYFARSYVNRLWGYLLGVGLIEPIDDIRAGNPPTNPELLQHLTDSFVESGFDVQQTLRMICNSRTYQLSVETNPLNEDDKLNYSHALPRRLPAEVIYDAVHAVTGAISDIPGVPKGTRAAALTDSGVKLEDGFLQNLGRPERESACECERNSDLQLGPVMALISGPTIGSAIADPKNELDRIVRKFSDDDQLVEEIFLRALGRRPRDAELAAFGQMTEMIQQDHVQIVEQLQTAEANWKQRREQLETQRHQRLAETEQKIAEHTAKIQPERDRMANERQQRIAAAEQTLAQASGKIDAKINELTAAHRAGVEWFPLIPTELSATNKAVLAPQPDRSIAASGKTDKGVYKLTFRTSLPGITGFRLEALADPTLPSQGPGLAPNGNFVLTELTVQAAPAAAPKDAAMLKIASGKADFLQGGFAIEQTFDGKTRDQGGWAVSGATGKTHWATFQLAQPLKSNGETLLTFELHQFHNAAEHTLGRFRISATTAAGEIPLGYSEPLAAALSTPAASRTAESKQLLVDHIASTDAEIKQATEAVAAAKQPLPADETLVALEKRKSDLSQPTVDDPALVQLRQDAQQSTLQLQNRRLTAAEDLTWALINSPAFLFNH